VCGPCQSFSFLSLNHPPAPSLPPPCLHAQCSLTNLARLLTNLARLLSQTSKYKP